MLSQHHVTLVIITLCIVLILGVFTSSFLFIFFYKRYQQSKKDHEQMKETARSYRQAVELSPQAIIIHDGESILFANKVSLKMLRLIHEHKIIGKSILDFIHPDSKETIINRMKNVKKGYSASPVELQLTTPGGLVIDVEVTGSNIVYEDQPAIQLVLQDVTRQNLIKKELTENKNYYESLFTHHPDAVYSLNLHGDFTNANLSLKDMIGYTEKEYLHMSFHHVIDPAYLPETLDYFKETIAGFPQTYETVLIKKDKGRVPVKVTNLPIIIDEQIIGVYGIAQNIAKEKKAIQTIQTLAYTDQLTGLPNRMWFYENLHQIVQKANERQETLAIFMIDLDDFKTINDISDHHMGDAFLKEVTQRLKNCLRENDKITRHGGDEFIIILENISRDHSTMIAKRILKEMNKAINFLGHEFYSSLSIGINLQQGGKIEEETLLKQAALAMYAAKANGKNNYQFYTEDLNDKVARKWQIESALYKAIANNELQLYYQPQINLHTGRLIGLEALIRWNPSFGFVSPAEFIPIAEKTGLIISLGEWVLKEACRQLKNWQKHNISVSINVSSRQFKDLDFIHKVKAIIEQEQVNPAYLEFEITESVMLDIEESAQFIQELRALGIKIAIDDFGKGYSSLHVITNLSFDTLKIDKSLIGDITNNNHNMAILKAIIGTANNKKRIVVEGIETQEQAEILKEFNVIGQGYFFQRPMPPNQLEQSLQQPV